MKRKCYKHGTTRGLSRLAGRAYYNDDEPFVVEWLRRLVARGLVADGAVDGRSIRDVHASDLAGAAQAHFFAGIGGWSHALRIAGWPDARQVWTGSCPCQPFSQAGKGKGVKDPRPQDRGVPLSQMVSPVGWATPTAQEAGGTPEQFLERKRRAVAKGARLGVSLTSLSLQASGLPSTSSPAPTASRGALNPEFVRWLMGFPPEWGSCAPTATASSRR